MKVISSLTLYWELLLFVTQLALNLWQTSCLSLPGTRSVYIQQCYLPPRLFLLHVLRSNYLNTGSSIRSKESTLSIKHPLWGK